MEQQLAWISECQGRWSATASHLKTVYERARWTTLGMSIAGALFAALASQWESDRRTVLAVASAVLFGMATFVTSRFLGTAKSAVWIRARAASEAIKHLAYAYAASAAPYDATESRDARIRADIEKIQVGMDDLLNDQVPPTGASGSTPRQAIDLASYCATRAKAQADWYQRSAEKYQRQSRRLRGTELVLALLTAVMTAVVGAISKDWLRAETGLDWVALTAVLATISGAILAHLEASRYDFLVVNYRAAARRLNEEIAAVSTPSAPSPDAWSGFVERCEAIIAQETGSWMARFSKP